MTVLFWVVMGICSFVMIAIGIFAYRKEGPMWFWSGTEEEVGVLVGGMLGMMLYYEHIHDVYTENNKMNER